MYIKSVGILVISFWEYNKACSKNVSKLVVLSAYALYARQTLENNLHHCINLNKPILLFYSIHNSWLYLIYPNTPFQCFLYSFQIEMGMDNICTIFAKEIYMQDNIKEIWLCRRICRRICTLKICDCVKEYAGEFAHKYMWLC